VVVAVTISTKVYAPGGSSKYYFFRNLLWTAGPVFLAVAVTISTMVFLVVAESKYYFFQNILCPAPPVF